MKRILITAALALAATSANARSTLPTFAGLCKRLFSKDL